MMMRVCNINFASTHIRKSIRNILSCVSQNVQFHQCSIWYSSSSAMHNLPDAAWALAQEQHFQHEALVKQLENCEVNEIQLLTRKIGKLSKVATLVTDINKKKEEILEMDEIIKETSDSQDSDDREMLELANAEQVELQETLSELESKLFEKVLPQDEDNDRNAILEVQAGAGGQEAAIFALDMLQMYEKFAQSHGWRWEIIDIHAGENGGCRKASAILKGKNVFGNLKYESGGHRVQRVPITDTAGRTHTSMMSVAVMPEAEEIDVDVDKKEVRIDIFRSSGPGGQSVNCTDSAVRLTHLPTGITVSMQDERCQDSNKVKAWKILRSRLYELKRKKQEEERAKLRGDQVSCGERTDRVRTYNFPQSRITDHRLQQNPTKFGIDKMMSGDLLHEIVSDLKNQDKIRAMELLYKQ